MRPRRSDPKLAIEYQAAIGDDGSARPNEIDAWAHCGNSHIMFVPQGLELSKAELHELGRSEIRYSKTRFQRDPWKSSRSAQQKAEQASRDAAAAAQRGRIGVDGNEIGAAGSSTTAVPPGTVSIDSVGDNTSGDGNYSLMREPSPMPGVIDADSPLITWGEIEGTPIALDLSAASNSPLISRTASTPHYRMLGVSAREEMHLELVDEISRKAKAEKEMRKRYSKGAMTPLKSPARGSTQRIAAMSPAAQRLLSRNLRVRTPTRSPLSAPLAGRRPPLLPTPDFPSPLPGGHAKRPQ